MQLGFTDYMKYLYHAKSTVYILQYNDIINKLFTGTSAGIGIPPGRPVEEPSK